MTIKTREELESIFNGAELITAQDMSDFLDSLNLTVDNSIYLTSVTAHNILSATHGDTLADSVVAGDILIGNATPKWARLAKGADGKFLKLVSGLPSWESIPAGVSFGTTTQIPYMNAGGTDFLYGAGLTYDGTYLTAGNIKASNLTSGRVTYATTGGLLTDAATMTFDGNKLTLSSATIATTLLISRTVSSYVASPTPFYVLETLTYTGSTTSPKASRVRFRDQRIINTGIIDDAVGLLVDYTRSSPASTSKIENIKSLSFSLTDTGEYVAGATSTELSAVNGILEVAPVINTGGTFTVNAIGMVASLSPSAPTITSGTYIQNTYGFKFIGTGHTVGTHTLYDFYTSATGADTHYGFYNAGSGHNLLGIDNVKTYFGTALDASILYDGTDMVFNSREVGTGNFVFSGGNVGVGTTAPGAKLQVNGDIYLGDSAGAGTMTIKPVYTGAAYPAGSNLTISAGNTVISDGYGGNLILNAGNGGTGSAYGGDITFNSGTGSGGAGSINFRPGGAGLGSVFLDGSITTFGYKPGNGYGDIQLKSSYGSDSNGGIVYITAAQGGATGNKAGGNVVIASGAGGGSGAYGNTIINSAVGNVGIGTTTPGEKLHVVGNTLMDDNYKLLLGTGKDASILYDGTNLVINPKDVGTGYLSVLGGIASNALTAGRIPVAGTGGLLGDFAGLTYADSGTYGLTVNSPAATNIFSNRIITTATNLTGLYIAEVYRYTGTTTTLIGGKITQSDERIVDAGKADNVQVLFFSYLRQAAATSTKSQNAYGVDFTVTHDGTFLTGATTLSSAAIRGTASYSPTINTGGTFTATVLCSDITLSGTPIVTSGTYVQNSYGYRFKSTAHTVGTHTLYDFYTSATGADVHYGFYNAGSGHNLLGIDNVKTYFGTGEDASISYDGTNWLFNPRAVGTGNLQILNGGTQVATEFTTVSSQGVLILRRGALSTNNATVVPTNASMFQMICNTTAGLRTAVYSATNTTTSFFQFNRWRGTDLTSTPPLSGDTVFRITGGGGVRSYTDDVEGGALGANTACLTAQFKMIMDGDAKNYNLAYWTVPVAITFETGHQLTNQTSAYIERGRLTSWGNWGFGTATPTYKVDVKGYYDVTTVKIVSAQEDYAATIGGTFTGTYNTYIIEITSGDPTSPNVFKWSDNDGATYTTGVAITGATQTLSNGLTVTFDDVTGFSTGEQWVVKAVFAQPLNVQTSAGVSVVSVLDTGNFVTNGGVRGKITTATDTYQILITDETVICNKTTAFTVTLPTAVVGQKFTIKNINTGTVTVEGASSDTIDGQLNETVYQWESMQVQCYVANAWVII